MALPTITLVNLTGGAINLEQLAVVVPASGSVVVSDFDRAGEVLNDEGLQVEMDAGNIRIDLSGGGLSSADTTKTLEQSKGIVKPIHDLDIKHNMSGSATPGVSDDEDAGYEVGSVWVDTTADTSFRCVDASSGAAVWQAAGGTASRIFEPGVITEAIQFAIDFNNQSSWTPNQTTTWVDTIAGTSGTAANTTITSGHLNFNGTTSEVDFGILTSAMENIFAGGGSVSCWIRAESSGEAGQGRVFDTTDTVSEGSVLATFEESAGTCRMVFDQFFSTSFGVWKTTDRDVTLDAWVFVVVTYDSDAVGNDPSIYIDAVSVGVDEVVTPIGTAVSDAGNSLIIGNRTAGTTTFDGDIEVVTFYDAVLTSDEITQCFNAQKERFGFGTAGTWAETLLKGQVSGGTDAVMTSGDTFRGVDDSSTTINGGTMAIRSGNNTALTGTADGGPLTIDGGSTTSTLGTSLGGDVTVTSGNQIAASGSGPAGSLFLRGATPTNFSGTGGSVTLAAGDGATGGGNGTAGAVTIQGGDASGGTTAGGGVSILAGDTTAGFATGADVVVTAGDNAGTGDGGGVIITGGSSAQGNGGDIEITAGSMTSTTAQGDLGGSVTITSGTGTAAPFDIGSISLIVPDAGAADNVSAGDVSITAGDNGVRDHDGGHVNITAGDTNTTSSGFVGGSVFLTCGNNVAGTTIAEGGSVVATPGTGAVSDGMFKILGSSTMEMIERAAVISGIAPTEGRWWVRDDAPNVPMFTDDDGNDWVLNANTIGGLQAAYEIVNTIVTSGSFGVFSVTGTEDITLSASAGDAALSALNVDITALGASAGGDITLTGSTSSAPAAIGGNIIATAGGGNTTGTGGQAALAAGVGGATGAGGLAKLTGGAGGATSGDGGGASIAGGAPIEGIGGAITIAAGDAAGTAHVGGGVTITGGDGVTTSAGGQVAMAAGAGGATGAGGAAKITAGAGGATSGDGGDVAIAAGTPIEGDGGAVSIVGKPGVGTNRSGGVVTIDAGDSTGSADGAAISITAGDGSSASVGGAVNIDGGDGRIGGDINITSGAPDGVLQAGDVNITAEKSGGTPGQILLTTESDDAITAPVAISTQSGFVDQAAEHRTWAGSDAITNGVTGQAVVDLGSVVTNGHNFKVVLSVTATDSVTDSNFVSYRYVGDFYRAGGTVTAVTAFEDTNTLVGTANWTSNISFSVAISGNLVRLELDNAGGSGTDNFNLAIGTMSVVQLGGRTA